MRMRKRVALFVGQPEEWLQSMFIEGFLQQAFIYDIDVCVFAMYQKFQTTRIREKAEANIFTLFEPDLFDAAVVFTSTIQTVGLLEQIEEDLHERFQKPVIFVDKESKYFYSVMPDNYHPVKQMISHLLEEHGYTDIAFLTGNDFFPFARQRLQGFLDCMQEHGLEVPDDRIFYGDLWYSSGETTAEQLLRDREHLPQAVACANDFMAIGLYRELVKAGVRIPEDIAITGYDASREGRKNPVPITSLPIPSRECGTYVMQYVKALLSGEEIGEFTAVVEPFIGKSCGCSIREEAAEPVIVSPKEENVVDEFDFNEGTMEDDLLMQADLFGVVNTIFSYVQEIRPFEGFYLCLNMDWSEENLAKGEGDCAAYSDYMLQVLKCGAYGKGEDRVDLKAEFDRRELLPEFSKEMEKPCVYYFTPLYFEEHCFGYAAVNYGNQVRGYDAVYKRWLNKVMHGLESFWRIHTLHIQNRKLETAQTRDPLTGLYNYRGFMKAATGMLQGGEYGGCLEIAVIELCGLSEVYMQLGNHDGDKVITDFTQFLYEMTAKELLCYLGNGEFLAALVSPEEQESGTEPLLRELQDKLADYNHRNGLGDKLSLVFGRMKGQAAGEDELGNLIGEAISRKNADKLREQRRGQSALTREDKRKMELVREILDHNRLHYFFQPIVDANSGEIFAYEALMRADTKEQVSPLDILKYAEHLGRLEDVEKATFANVLSYVEAHEEQFANKKIFINSIPGVQIPKDAVLLIRERLKHFCGKIVVELTEQAQMDDSELETFKKKYEALGIDTAVDDYGTGYSNVYNLLRYMPNFVKIDRMLLANIQLSAQKQHFVKEIIEFSHNNQIVVLAEGVETPEELKMVTSLGVDLIQGYYTGRPSAEVISRIDRKVQNEIVQYGQYAAEKSRSKIYQAGQDSVVSLVKLVSAHYSKIIFVRDVPHQEVTIAGLPGFLANVEIEVEDGYSGKIELRDADLSVHNEQPSIRLGENCDVTIVLTGENIIEQGGILVPGSSKLMIQGDGNLVIRQIAVNGYGIGNDKDGKCGSLYFEQDGMITVQGNVMHGVGIGAGCGGHIDIRRGRYFLQLSGEEVVGIGTLYSDVELSIHSCALKFDLRSTTNVGIGSIQGDVVLDVIHVGLDGFFSAGKCVCIGTIEGKAFQFSLAHATGKITAHANTLCGIGSILGDTVLFMKHFSLKMQVEGDEAIAMGNRKKTAEIHTVRGDMTMEVKNRMDYDIGAEIFEITSGFNEFMLNGREVKRAGSEA